jgi:hypothetical protein
MESGCTVRAGSGSLVENPDTQGYYYAPTVFGHVPPESPQALDEIFGPVLPIIRVREPAEAISIANGTRYGLATSVFTSRNGSGLPICRTDRNRHDPHRSRSGKSAPRTVWGKKGFRSGRILDGTGCQEFLHQSVKANYAKW